MDAEVPQKLMIQVASDDVSGVVQMLKKHEDELMLNMGEGTLIKNGLAEGLIKKRPADTQGTISFAQKRAEVEVTTLKPTMVEPEPPDNSGDEEQHSLLPEVPMSFREVADMIV